MPVLLVEKGPSKGAKFKLNEGSEVIIGTGAGSGLILKDPLIAAQQLAVTGADGAFWISDIGGTDSIVFINGEQLEAETALRPGDQIEVGETLISFTADAVSKKMADPLVGTKVGGYEILERVGRGGMGVVYKAVQLSLNREVALKLLAKKYVQDKNFINMFVEEARSAAVMNHPNIVQAYDVGKAGDSYYFSMEYMAGGSIQDILAVQDKVPAGEALAMLIGAAKGLEFAEKKKIVHCDIKPDNLMLTDEGVVKIGDLGLSKNLGKGGKQEGDSQIFGTPHFVAPEQVQGKPLDHRTDLYSLGASFFRILSGRTPFQGETARELVVKHLKEEPPKLTALDPDLPQEVDDIIQKLMRKDPSDRYQSAGDLVGDIRKAMLAVGADGGYTDLIPGIAGGGKRSKTGLVAAIGVGIVLLIIIIAMAMSGDPGGGMSPEEIAQQEKAAAELKAAQDLIKQEGAAGKDYEDILDKRGELKDDAHPVLEKMCVEFLNDFPASKLAPRVQSMLDDMPGIRASRAKGAIAKEFAPLQRKLKSAPFTDDQFETALRAFIAKYPASKEAKEAGAWIAKAEESRGASKQHEIDAQQALDPIAAAVAKLAKEDRWGEAITKVAGYDLKKWAGTKAAAAAASLKATTESDAGKAFLARSKAASAKDGQGEFEDAIRDWRHIVDRWGIDKPVALAKEEIAKLRSKITERVAAAYRAKIAAEMAILRGVDQSAADEKAALQFAEAKSRFEQLENDDRLTTVEVKQELENRLRDLTHAHLAMASLVNSAEAKKNKVTVGLPEERFKGQKAKVTGADGEWLSVSYSRGTVIKTRVKWVDFSPEELLVLAKELMPGGGSSAIQRGVLALLWGLVAEATAEFESALGDPGMKPEAKYYLERLEEGGLVDSTAEAAAQKLREQALALMFQAENTRGTQQATDLFHEAEKLLQELKDKYPGTRAAKGLPPVSVKKPK